MSGVECGGCHELGAHKRWCPAVVGPQAARWGTAAARLEDIGDLVGSADPVMANDVWRLAAQCEHRAGAARARWIHAGGEHDR